MPAMFYNYYNIRVRTEKTRMMKSRIRIRVKSGDVWLMTW